MESTGVKRKLTVILAADAEGYTRLMRAAEETTLETLSGHREVIDGLIARHDGRIVNTGGDSVLAEFGSAVEAVRCAIAIQEELRVRNAQLADDRKLRFRIGVNVGDVMVKDDDLFGDGVNVAARLEGLAEPGGVCVSGSVFEQVKHKLSLSFEDIGPQAVKNVDEPVPAFRIVPGSVSVTPGAPTDEAAPAPRWRTPAIAAAAIVAVVLIAAGGVAVWDNFLRPPPALPEKPSIAVLPFDNVSEIPEQEYFSDGITEDIITDLSKISGLFVVARNSTFLYKGKDMDIKLVAQRLGARYVLEGSVRRVGDRLRVTAQLIDAATGYHLWAERYDRDMKDVFAVQDEITEKIVAALKVKLTVGEQARMGSRYTDNLEAYDLFLRGREYQLRGSIDGVTRAQRLMEKAIELDPKFAAAYAELAHLHYLEWNFEWSENRQPLNRALVAAQKAVALDDSLPLAHTRLGWIYLWKKQHEKAVAEAERAVELDPNIALGHARLGEILNFAGRPEEAIGLIEQAMRLDPHYPFYYLYYLGHSYYRLEQTEQAIAAIKRSVVRNPDFISAHRLLAVIYGELGREEEARAEVAEVLRLNPLTSVEVWRDKLPYKDPSVWKRYVEGLRKADLPMLE